MRKNVEMVLSIYIFFARHHRDNVGLLAPLNTWCGNEWFGEQVSSKYGTWYSGPLCNLFELAFALVSIKFARCTELTSPNKDKTAVHGYGPTFIGSCRVGVSQSQLFLRSISLAVILYVSPFIWLIKSHQEILRNLAALLLAVLCIQVLLFEKESIQRYKMKSKVEVKINLNISLLFSYFCSLVFFIMRDKASIPSTGSSFKLPSSKHLQKYLSEWYRDWRLGVHMRAAYRWTVMSSIKIAIPIIPGAFWLLCLS